MAVISQNGWSANDESKIDSFRVPGTDLHIRLRKGPVAVVLLYILEQFNARVEPLDGPVLDDWGFAERPVRGSTTDISNHASGTAGDANALRHPLGVHGTFTPEQVKTIHQILAEVEHVARWGGDYEGRVDEMHFEIVGSATEVARVAQKLQEDDVALSDAEKNELVKEIAAAVLNSKLGRTDTTVGQVLQRLAGTVGL